MIELGYWKHRGLLAALEIFCEHLGIDYVTNEYEVIELEDGSTDPQGNKYDRSAWFDVKYDLGLPYPNLPYLIDNKNNLRITDSFAILKYLGRKASAGLPKSIQEWAIAENLESILGDIRYGFSMVCYLGASPHNYFQNKLPILLEGLANFLRSKNYLCTENKPTYVDFYAFEILDQHLAYKNDIFEDYDPGNPEVNSLEGLKNWHFRCSNLSAVRKYRNSVDYAEFPINNKMAKWGGKNEREATEFD